MSKSKWSLLSKEELKDLIENNERFSEVLEKIGYTQIQDRRVISAIKEFCDKENINYSHLKDGADDFSGTRICSKCGLEKDIQEFYFINGKPMYWCKECQKNKERNKYQDKVNQINEYKKTLCCKKCGEKRFYLFDFHHRNPEEKDYAISDHSRASLETIKSEIEKCDVLCANCHREWHYLSSHNLVESYNAWLGEMV